MMFIQAATILVCLAIIAGQVQGYPRYKNELLEAEIESMERALFTKLLQNRVAQIEGFVVCNEATKGPPNFFLGGPQINSLTNVFKKTGSNKKTYMFVPPEQTGNGKELFVKSDGVISGEQHAEDIMYQQQTKNDLPLPREFYITNSPCPCCATNLIKRYAALSDPVKIHFAHFYTNRVAEKGPLFDLKKAEQKQLSTECLAKMMLHNFSFEIWNWKAFREKYVANEKCKAELEKDRADNLENILAEDQMTTEALTKAKEIVKEIQDKKKTEADICNIAVCDSN